MLLPGRHLILTEIAILGLFALSLDLILGYAGIISLGHAAFFGFGAYAAGLLAKHEIIAEPLLALLASGLAAALLGFVTSFLVLRGSDLTRLMVTLGVALVLREIANRYAWLTGGADGLQGVEISRCSAASASTSSAAPPTATGSACCSCCSCWRGASCTRRSACRCWRSGAIRCARRRSASRSTRRLVAIYTLAAAYAGIAGALLAQTTAFVSLDVFDFDRSADVLLVLIIGGTGYLYGGLIGAIVFKLMQDYLSALTPQYWQFWIGLFLVVIVLVGRERISSWTLPFRTLVGRLDWRSGRDDAAVPTAEGR